VIEDAKSHITAAQFCGDVYQLSREYASVIEGAVGMAGITFVLTVVDGNQGGANPGVRNRLS
jgi:hypothetical protein